MDGVTNHVVAHVNSHDMRIDGLIEFRSTHRTREEKKRLDSSLFFLPVTIFRRSGKWLKCHRSIVKVKIK